MPSTTKRATFGCSKVDRPSWATGKVELSPKPTSWQEFFELADSTDIPADFMNDSEDIPSEEKSCFEPTQPI